MTYKQFMYTLLYISRYISHLTPHNIIDIWFLNFFKFVWYILERYTTVEV